jgi:hypothetical protein
MVGTVSKTDLGPTFRTGTFLIHADIEPVHVEQIVDPALHVYSPHAATFRLPEWFPPFAMRECVDLHSALVAYIDRNVRLGGWTWDRKNFYEVIRYAWAKRLPIEALEIWRLLAAHGVPSHLQEEISVLFDEGTDILVYAMGRRAVKRKRLNARVRTGT